MRRASCFASGILAALFTLSAAANANSVAFNVSGTLESTTPFSGTILLNTSTGTVTSWNIQMPAISGIPSFDFTTSNSAFAYLSPSELQCGGIGGMQFQAPGLLAFFILPESNLVGFKGSTIIPSVACSQFVTELSAYAILPLDFSTIAPVTQGSVTPTAVVPEPTSALLVLTGLAGLRLRRRSSPKIG